MATVFDRQIQNRNYLSPIGFKFTLAKDPKVSFFSNSARIPEINLNIATQPSYLKDLDVPGDKLTYGDFNLRFLVDENLENYLSIHNWLTGLGSPESLAQYENLIDGANRDPKKAYSDGSLHILNSNYQAIAVIKFLDLFPSSLTSLEFTATDTDINYFTAEASFKYTVYQILGIDGKPL